jgi:hypothetical protein
MVFAQQNTKWRLVNEEWLVSQNKANLSSSRVRKDLSEPDRRAPIVSVLCHRREWRNKANSPVVKSVLTACHKEDYGRWMAGRRSRNEPNLPATGGQGNRENLGIETALRA